MPTRLEGTLPLEIAENDAGRLCIKQISESGEEQAITLDLGQAEHVANWIIQYAQMATDDLMEE